MHSHSVYVCVCRPVITWLSACVSVCVCWVSTQLFHYFPFTSRTSRRPQQTGRWSGCWGATDWPSEVTGVKGWHQQQPHPETNHCVCVNEHHTLMWDFASAAGVHIHTHLHTHTHGSMYCPCTAITFPMSPSEKHTFIGKDKKIKGPNN